MLEFSAAFGALEPSQDGRQGCRLPAAELHWPCILSLWHVVGTWGKWAKWQKEEMGSSLTICDQGLGRRPGPGLGQGSPEISRSCGCGRKYPQPSGPFLL